MNQSRDNQTSYGYDQDREPPNIPGAVEYRGADRSPDDFGPEGEDADPIDAPGAGVRPAGGGARGR